MPCQLNRDPSATFDFVANANDHITVRSRGVAGNAGIAAATLNNQPLLISGGDAVACDLVAGINILRLVIVASVPNDTIEIVEDCGEEVAVLDRYVNDPADPVTGYSIMCF